MTEGNLPLSAKLTLELRKSLMPQYIVNAFYRDGLLTIA